jgi:tRNA-uridine 2-sulfurtransferase
MQKRDVKKKVFVGLSGGVDSSVSAALLKKAGFDVAGVFIKVWQPDMELTGGCTWHEDRLDAMRVCAKLDIPFYTLDLEKEYKKEVVDYMIAEYKAGRTPNPDVMCNKYVKFGGFFDWAMKNGADYVATGHYAQNIKDEKTNNFKLLAGKDKNKDQSYFLWTLTQKQLSKTLFPVGNIEKPEVRKLAKKFGLETATKKDSQGLCFIGKVDMVDFLKNFIKTKEGNVLSEEGKIVGTHQGAELYTIGQRHGFLLTHNSPDDSKMFVLSKDVKANTITISSSVIKEDSQDLKEFILRDVNWILNEVPDLTKYYQARIRYRGELSKCKIESINNGGVKVVFQKNQNFPAPGQSIVIYGGEICLGGGIIE